MTLSELSDSSSWILCFNSFRSFSKLLTLHSKIANPFEKYYSNILLGHFNMTTESMFFNKAQHDNKFINKYGIPIPNILFKTNPPCLEPTVISLTFLLTI